MNYDFYKTFVVLSETKNFSKTSEKLNIVQSTVSNRIQELEKYLGSALFKRTNKTVTLTQSGISFLPYARRIIAIEEEGLNIINKLNYKDILKIGTVHSLYSGYVKNTIKRFMKIKTNTSIKIIINHSPNILEMLSDNIIDIGIVSSLPKSDKYICTNILKDEVILVTKNSDDFRNEIHIHELRNINLFYTDISDNFNRYIEDQINCKLHFQLILNQMFEVIDYLYEGLGYAFILKSLVLDPIKENKLKEVKIKDTKPYVLEGYVVIEKSKLRTESIKCFTELISEEIRDKKSEN